MSRQRGANPCGLSGQVVGQGLVLRRALSPPACGQPLCLYYYSLIFSQHATNFAPPGSRCYVERASGLRRRHPCRRGRFTHARPVAGMPPLQAGRSPAPHGGLGAGQKSGGSPKGLAPHAGAGASL